LHTSNLRFNSACWPPACVVMAIVGLSACKTETSPTFNGVTSDTLFTIEGGGVTMDVAVIKPAAGATVSGANPGILEFTVRCKDPFAGIRWGFQYLREDNSLAVFQAVGCPVTNLQAQQKFGGQATSEYDFVRGHTVRLRMVVAANADALMNGGPFTYVGTRDIVTWNFAD